MGQRITEAKRQQRSNNITDLYYGFHVNKQLLLTYLFTTYIDTQTSWLDYLTQFVFRLLGLNK